MGGPAVNSMKKSSSVSIRKEFEATRIQRETDRGPIKGGVNAIGSNAIVRTTPGIKRRVNETTEKFQLRGGTDFWDRVDRTM